MKFVITVDDAGLNQPPETERRCLDFFARHGVPASFFVVPCKRDGGELADDPDWLARARACEAQGHDFQLHGCTHAGFEFGAPPWWMVQVCGEEIGREAAAGYPEQRRGWTPEALREKFARAIAAFERAFERRPQVFRAGCLAAQEPAFEIMAELGLRYDSNRIVDPRGWEYIAQKFDTHLDWDPEVLPRPYYLTEEVIEVPAISEYAWTLSADTLHHFIDLAHEDLGRASEGKGVFILMCHLQRVGGEDELPRQVLDAIFEEARAAHAAEFMTLQTLIEEIEAGRLEVAPNPSVGN